MPRLGDQYRRMLLKSSLVASTAMAGLLTVNSRAGTQSSVTMQLGWIPGVNQAGEVVAKRKGFYSQEGIDFAIQPGGPNIDGVAIVAFGRYQVGQVSSSPSVMLAVSQGLPIRCFAVGAQKHPYAYFSLSRNPARKPADLIGKRVGIQTTGAVLLRALLAKNGIEEKQVKVIPIGTDLSPLLTGQVDVAVGWLTSTTALKALGTDRVDMTLWDAGVRLYALPYYATAQLIQTQPELLERFLKATARGWKHARSNRDEATDLLVQEYPNLNRSDERQALDVMLDYSFGGLAQTDGWGAMDPAIWQEQIALYAELGQFTARVPAVSDVIWMDGLRATLADRKAG